MPTDERLPANPPLNADYCVPARWEFRCGLPKCRWEQNLGQGRFRDCEMEAVEQFVFVYGDGSHDVSKPLCAKHSEAMQPAETVLVLPLERRP